MTRALFVGLLLLAGAPLAAAEGDDPPAALLEHDLGGPYEIEDRRAVLLGATRQAKASLCGVPYDSWAEHGVTRLVTPEEQPGQTLAMTVMEAHAVYLAYEGPDRARARNAIVANLDRWARGDALSRLRAPDDANTYYNLDRTLLPIVVAWGAVRGDPEVDPAKRGRVEEWLDGLIRRRGPERLIDPERISSRNNHSYLRDSVTMSWGAVIGDGELFGAGLQRFAAALGQMRADGSLPLETDRGPYALFYQRHAIASLVTIAEIAAARGFDLYAGTNAEGKTLHDAVGFLAEALQDREALSPYAPQAQDLSFLDRRGHERHYMAWIEPYLARFPDSRAGLALWGEMQARGRSKRPLVDEYSGGNTSCLFAVPSDDRLASR